MTIVQPRPDCAIAPGAIAPAEAAPATFKNSLRFIASLGSESLRPSAAQFLISNP